MEQFKITFQPDNKSIVVPKDTTILSAGISAGVYIKSSCGGDGVCGQCKVILKSGSVLAQPTGRISRDEKEKGIYLACLTEIHSDCEIEIPPESRLDFEKISPIYSEPEEVEIPAQPKDLPFVQSPLAIKLYLELPPPNLEDKVSDLERIDRQIRKLQEIPAMPVPANLATLGMLGEQLRDSDWKITVTLGKRNDFVEIIRIESGDSTKENYGFCVDIGTTTISGQLIDLNSRKILGTKAGYNKQASFGSDVITRIIFAKEAEGLEKLHRAVVDEINIMIQELIKEHNIDLNNVNSIVCAGNTTMTHLLLRIDPTFIRREPYVPTANFLPVIHAYETEINITPRGLLLCVPGISSYVGGDITAGVLSCGQDKEENLCLLIDIGTNGEIVLGNREFLVACAASAGPAFEGSGVKCGMRATKGAIEKVKINPEDFNVNYSTIGTEKPRGICGSGYIDLISEMLKNGIINKLGKITAEKHNRIRSGEFGKEFVLVEKEKSGTLEDIVITEADIDNIKRAKAAIYSAAATLIRNMGLDFSDIKKIFIAGGFGTSLDMDKAIEIGLLPDLDRKRFVFVGNSSLAGARQMLLSSEAVKNAEEIARKMAYLELSTENSYMDEYMAALFFPHTDLGRFPSVKG